MKPDESRRFPIEELLSAAREARSRAYAPYSHFEVGACVDVGGGVMFTGANVENAAYNVGICAERAAIAAAVSAGYRDIHAIAVAGPPGVTCAPCGACRQFIVEFGSGVAVTYTTPSGHTTSTIDQLLPDFFGPHSLHP